jgi:DNA-directed RNA polymerase specialized sigma24 family protein
VTGSSGSAAAGSAVRRYCRARLGAVSGVGCADRLATSVVAQVTGGEDAPFDREAYRAAVRAVDRALASPRPDRCPGTSAAIGGSPARFAAAVEDLPAPVRDVLVLRTLVGLTREEVAHALGVSDLTVLRRQQEAMRMLRVEDL